MFDSWKHRWFRTRARLPVPVTILLYHRIGQLDFDPFALCVSPAHFEEHLDVIRRVANPMSLRTFVKRLRSGTLPRRAVVVTFDDGYADNALVAGPLLELHETPATFFLTTGPIERKEEFWWDELERVILHQSSFPTLLTIPRRHGSVEISFAASADGWINTPMSKSWRIWQPTRNARCAAYRQLWDLLRDMTHAERTLTLASIRTSLGVNCTNPRQSHRPLTVSEIVQVSGSRLLELGAHSVTHSALGQLQPEQQRREICESKRQIEDISGKRVDAFSYPFGGPGDFTATTARIAEEAGYTSACTARPGQISEKVLWELPRVAVQDISGDAFEEALSASFQ